MPHHSHWHITGRWRARHSARAASAVAVAAAPLLRSDAWAKAASPKGSI